MYAPTACAILARFVYVPLYISIYVQVKIAHTREHVHEHTVHRDQENTNFLIIIGPVRLNALAKFVPPPPVRRNGVSFFFFFFPKLAKLFNRGATLDASAFDARQRVTFSGARCEARTLTRAARLFTKETTLLVVWNDSESLGSRGRVIKFSIREPRVLAPLSKNPDRRAQRACIRERRSEISETFLESGSTLRNATRENRSRA